MKEIEDLEEKVSVENVAESAMVEGRELMDTCEVARIATEQLGTKNLSVILQGVMYDGVERPPQEVTDRFDGVLFNWMGEAGEKWRRDLDLVDRTLSITQQRLEVQDLCEALTSAWMDITSAQKKMMQAEEIVEETKHRLDNLLVRLRKAEKEDKR